jgi:hypothetical protein
MIMPPNRPENVTVVVAFCRSSPSQAHLAAHARGAAAYAAKAAGLAAPDDPTAVADEGRWQQGHASPDVRAVLYKLPPPTRPAGTLATLINELHTTLAGGG